MIPIMTREQMREEVLEMFREPLGSRLDWDERQELERLKNYASDDEIAQLHEEWSKLPC